MARKKTPKRQRIIRPRGERLISRARAFSFALDNLEAALRDRGRGACNEATLAFAEVWDRHGAFNALLQDRPSSVTKAIRAQWQALLDRYRPLQDQYKTACVCETRQDRDGGERI